jgi:hypothetical protein
LNGFFYQKYVNITYTRRQKFQPKQMCPWQDIKIIKKVHKLCFSSR